MIDESHLPAGPVFDWFTPRLVEGSAKAPRVMLLDPIAEPLERMIDCVSRVLDLHGEVVFAFHRCAIQPRYVQLGKEFSAADLPEYGAPDVLRHTKPSPYVVFSTTFPPEWDTWLVRGYALSSKSQTTALALKAKQWIAELGAAASNRLIWGAPFP